MELFHTVTPYCMMTQLELVDILTCECVNNTHILLVTTITVNHVIL